MHIDNHRDEEAVDKLAKQISEIAFTKHDPPYTHPEIFAALMGAIAGALHTIECPDCRARCGKAIKKTLPRLKKARRIRARCIRSIFRGGIRARSPRGPGNN